MFLNINKLFAYFKSNDNPSLMDVFRPFYIILCCLGLFPYTIKYPTHNDPRVETKSIIPNSIGASIVNLTLSILMALNVKYYIRITQRIVYMINIHYFLRSLILLLGGNIAYISIYKNRKTYVKILNEISSIWDDLGLTEVNIIIKYFKCRMKIMIFSCLTLLVIWHAATFSMLRSTQTMFIETAYTLLPEILFTAIVGFFYVLILMVACLLKNIEQNIQNLRQKEREDVLDALTRLEYAYAKTIEVKREINGIFEVIIAIMLAEGFYATLRQAHGIYHALYHVRQKFYNMISGISFVLFPVTKLYAISHTGSMLRKVVRYIYKYLVMIVPIFVCFSLVRVSDDKLRLDRIRL